MRRFAIVLCYLGLTGPSARGDEAAPFTHRTPVGVAFTVTADGLSSIRVGDRELARGGWYAWNAGPGWFGRGEDAVLAHRGYSRELYASAAKSLTRKTIERLSPTAVRVRHVQGDVTAVHEFRFAGEDVTVLSRVENLHPTAELAVPAVGGLRFTFVRPPEGLMPNWHISYLRHVGLEALHPSHLTRIGGSYASDGRVGVGLSPRHTGLSRTLFFWDFDDWNPGQRDAVPVRWLTYLHGEPIPPLASRTLAMTLRVSPNADWRHLLAPYRDHFLATFGKPRYAVDFRAVAVAHINHSTAAIKPDNPFGLHGGFRRLDLDPGVKEFGDLLIPALKAADGQGVIIWGQTGENPRGEMYRTDFDVLPPELERGLKATAGRFTKAGLKVGVCARPGEVTYRLDWTRDGTMLICGDRPEHLEMMTRRFSKMRDLGVSLFYLDSFGASLNDVKIMRHLRAKLGPDVGTFVEHQCDVMLVYSGAYSETDFWAKGSADGVTADAYVPRSGLRFLEVGRWMLGDVPVITRLYESHGKLPADFEPAERYFYRHRLTPMVQDFTLPAKAAGVGKLQADYLAGPTRWRPR
ncbi:MAG: hypothetical protein U0736_24345 [Gemmataceae bacterium]